VKYVVNQLITSFVVSGWPAACLDYFSSMKMDAVRFSETSINFYQNTRRHNSEDSTLNTDGLTEAGVIQNIGKEEANWKERDEKETDK
jgi:hypothetical protein